jgi:hypothetical protein
MESRRVAHILGGDDPLPATAESLREMLEATVGVANASQAFDTMYMDLTPGAGLPG